MLEVFCYRCTKPKRCVILPLLLNKLFMKNTGMLAVLATALVLLGFGCSKQNENFPTASGPDASVTTPTTTVVTTSTAPITKAPVKTGINSVVAKAMKYEEALEKYRENGLMQFVDCHATPGTFTFKKGYTFMIDNRDNKTRTIVVQGISYRLAAYNYALVVPKKTGESFITCDGGGSATLRIQP